jgi:hypothetical protein
MATDIAQYRSQFFVLLVRASIYRRLASGYGLKMRTPRIGRRPLSDNAVFCSHKVVSLYTTLINWACSSSLRKVQASKCHYEFQASKGDQNAAPQQHENVTRPHPCHGLSRNRPGSAFDSRPRMVPTLSRYGTSL